LARQGEKGKVGRKSGNSRPAKISEKKAIPVKKGQKHRHTCVDASRVEGKKEKPP